MTHTASRTPRGFTLIEMLVVMAVLGLASSVVLPGMWRMLQAAQARGNIADMEAAIASLPARRFFAATPATLDRDSFAALVAPLPAGWDVAIPTPVRFGTNGVCSGGTLTLSAPGGLVLNYRLAPLTCTIEALPG